MKDSWELFRINLTSLENFERYSDACSLLFSRMNKLMELRKRFLNIVPLSGQESEVFLFKIAKAAKPLSGALRLPLEESYMVIND